MGHSETTNAADGAFADDLRQVSLFQDLDEGELRRLGRKFVEMEVPRHTIIAREGDETVGFYVVRSGAVAVFREAVGKPVMLLARLRRGEFFGELGIFGEGKHMASVRASEESRILRIARQDLLEFFAQQPEIEQKLRLAAARRHLGHVTAFLDLGRRREVRIHLGQSAQLEVAPGDVRRVVLENLSLDGLSLTGAPESWQTGRSVSFGLGLREGQLQLKGRIVWRAEETVGMAFEKLTPNHDTVIQMAIRVALELRKYGSQ
ncbi:MAG: cyclic nucleotide-binding domain-containing protein [Acidobacteriota bacterium]